MGKNDLMPSVIGWKDGFDLSSASRRLHEESNRMILKVDDNINPHPSFCNQIKQDGKLTPIAVEAVRAARMEQNNGVMEEALKKIRKTTKEYMDAYSEPNSILNEVSMSQLFVFLIRSIDKIIDDPKVQEALK